jgi:IS30 family transposase
MPHLTRDQLLLVFELDSQNMTGRAIAKILGCHFSTVSRVINMEIYPSIINSQKADLVYQQRSGAKKKRTPYKLKGEKADFVKEMIHKGLSPKAIELHLKEVGQSSVSHETIYIAIRREKENGGDLHRHLPRSGKKD